MSCGPSTATNSPDASPSPEPVSEEPSDGATEDESSADEPEPDSPPAAAEPDGDPVLETPIEKGAWRPALPPIADVVLDDDDKEHVAKCQQTHGTNVAQPSPDAVMAAAECLRREHLYAPEAALLGTLVMKAPTAPEAADAMRLMGLRLEQLGKAATAMDAYDAYLRTHPKQPDAKALGMRAVCIAHEVGNEDKRDALLDALQRNYGRKGFRRPKLEELAGLCGMTPQE